MSILDQKYERFRSERVRGYGCFVLTHLKKKMTTVMDHNTTKESRGLPHKCILDGEILVYNKRIKKSLCQAWND